MGKRFIGAAFCGVAVGVLYTAVSAMLGHNAGTTVGEIVANCMWRIFIFSIFSPLGAIITELKWGDPELD